MIAPDFLPDGRVRWGWTVLMRKTRQFWPGCERMMLFVLN